MKSQKAIKQNYPHPARGPRHCERSSAIHPDASSMSFPRRRESREDDIPHCHQFPINVTLNSLQGPADGVRTRTSSLCMLNQVQHDNGVVSQSGRSMVEMLGVLAVIGVLSVTAIGGYRYGMDKYHANEILKGVSARAMTASMEKTQNHTLTLAGHADDINGYMVGKETAPGGDNTRFAITVSGVPESICDLVLRDGPENALYVYGGDGTVTSCSNGDNTLAFIFNDNLSTTLKANDYNGNEDGCTGAGYTLCADDTCRADCCAGVDTTCQTCAANGTVTPKEGTCTITEPNDGVCSNGACVANLCLGVDVDAQCQSCDSVTGEITDTITCNNHGTCSNGTCSCDMGYSTSAGATTCTICSAGTYAVAGSSSCTPCAAGYYATAGSESCTVCPAGTYAAAGVSSCTPCAAGYYAAAGSGSCTQCGENTYSLAGAGSCTPCESGKTSPAGSTSASACTSPAIACTTWLDGDGNCCADSDTQACCEAIGYSWSTTIAMGMCKPTLRPDYNFCPVFLSEEACTGYGFSCHWQNGSCITAELPGPWGPPVVSN